MTRCNDAILILILRSEVVVVVVKTGLFSLSVQYLTSDADWLWLLLLWWGMVLGDMMGRGPPRTEVRLIIL